VIYGALVYLAIKGMRSKNVHAYAIALFTITLAPVSNIFFDYVVAFAERALYTPSFGFIFLFSIACYRGYVYILNRGWVSGKTLRAVSVSLFGLLTLVYAGIAFQRNPVWKDDLTLFSTDAKTLPDNVRLNLNYAQEVINRNTQTTPVPMNDALKDAKKSIDRAMQMVPDMSKAYLLYGNLAKITGDYQNAENNYRQAMETDPNNPAVYFNLGLMAQLSENLPQAKRYYLTSISLFPGYTSALQNLGIVYGRQNNLDSCIIVLEKAFSLDRDPAICFNLENAYSLKGDQAKAAYYRSMLSPKQK